MAPRLIALLLVLLALENVKCPNLNQLRGSVTSEDQRSFIKINVLLDTPPRVVATQLAEAIPEGHLKERMVYNRYGDFKEGRRTDVADLPKSGKPRTETTEDNKEKVKQLILESEGMRTQ